MSKKKLAIILYIAFVVITIVSIITLSILGNKERTGYIEIGEKNSYKKTYGIRMRYYDKVFRNSDIYEVHINKSSIPQYLQDIKWDSLGSPFGNIEEKAEIEQLSKIDGVIYTLKVKKLLMFYLLFIMIASPILYIAFSKSDIKVFSQTDEVEALLNKPNSKKNIYYILGIFAILFIFALLWYSKGSYTAFSGIDSVVESTGSVVNFKFPENLFEKVAHINNNGYWYKTRWTGTCFIYLSSNVISPIYRFVTGNSVEAIFFSQAIMVMFIFTSIGFLLALYLAQVFDVKIISKNFLIILFFAQSMQISVYSIALENSIFSRFIGVGNGGSPIANYHGAVLILLIALFPYWRYFITNKWDDWYNKKGLVAVYHLVIILTALSSPAVTIFYGFVSGLMFIYFIIKEKSIPKINHKIASTLYASIFWTIIGVVAESSYIIKMSGGGFISRFESLQASLIIIGVYTLIFAMLTILPLVVIKKIKNGSNSKLIKNILIAILLCFIGMLSHLLIASTKNTQTFNEIFNAEYTTSFNSNYICVANIFLVIAVTISFSSIFFYLKLSFVKGFMLMFLVSHFVFYIGADIGGGTYLHTRKLFTILYEANKSKYINSNIIYLDKEIYERYFDTEFGDNYILKINQNFARQFNLIDKDAVIMKKED